MESGNHGPCGMVALKPVAGGGSRETGCAMDPSLEENIVLEKEKRSVIVTKRDVQVSE